MLTAASEKLKKYKPEFKFTANSSPEVKVPKFQIQHWHWDQELELGCW